MAAVIIEFGARHEAGQNSNSSAAAMYLDAGGHGHRLGDVFGGRRMDEPEL